MSANTKLVLLIGFTLVGGAVGFYIEDKVVSSYKEEHFRRFEKVFNNKVQSSPVPQAPGTSAPSSQKS